MIFHCTLVPRTLVPCGLTPSVPTPPTPTSGSTPDGQLIELAIQVPDRCPGADLEAAIARRYGTGGLSVRGAPVAAMSVGVPPLVHGAVLVEGAAASGSVQGRPQAATLLLTVEGGPGAGTLVALHRGRFRIGRSGTEIVIPDAALSREHARLDVSDSDVTVVDLGSVNGTIINGRKVRTAAVSTASSIRCGDSTISLRLGPPSVPENAADSVTALAGSSVAAPLVVRGAAAPTHRAAMALAAALPLLVGVGLALLTGMWMFLAFTAVSAVSVLVPMLSGRRQRRDLIAAVAQATVQDRERRRRAAPSAADLAIACAAGLIAAGRTAEGQSSDICLRLGLADQSANIRIEPPDSGFRPPPLGQVPLTLDPAPEVVTVHGPAAAMAGLVRSFVMQLAAYPACGSTHLLLHGPADTLPLPARFLPGVTLSAHDATTVAILTGGADGTGGSGGPGGPGGTGGSGGPGGTGGSSGPSGTGGTGGGFDRGVLILWDSPGPPGTAASTRTAGEGPAFRSLATAHGWRVIECSAEQRPGRHPGIVLGRRSVLVTAGASPRVFIPDLVPAVVFDRFCRGFGATKRTTATPPPAVLDRRNLADVLPLGAREVSRRWSRSGPDAGLGAPVGAGILGTLRIDLKADGPHFLVAGTTGSGKSEFLRTLAAGLAASHSPDRVNLLFIDFKGGSGLAPLAGLPHCVGMLTDLGAAEVERTLVSLRAEVRRREELLARAMTPDLAAYESSQAAGPPVPYLVIFIDEFRILVDEVPGALSELMRIAAIGRSLGIHLIMATQRPQGALNADIRANVTSSIALRVQSGPESFDVMGSGLAAAIPITRPGRAFLSRGAQAPEEFQTATLTPGVAAMTEGAVTVRTATEHLMRPQAVAGLRPGDSAGDDDPDGGPVKTPAQGAAPLIDTVVRLWQDSGGRRPRRPVADRLPLQLSYPDSRSGDRNTVRLGRVDLPELQCVAALDWSPAGHGNLGLVEAGAGTADAAVVLAVDQLLNRTVESHLYILDAAGAFSAAAAAPRVGAVAGLHEVRRAARVLRRVAEEVTSRLSAPAAGPRPGLVLVLSGWGAWVSAFRSGPLAWAEDLVHDIVRDGSRAAITVIASGGRELVTARFFAGLPNRIYFPAGSTEEGRLAWPRLPALEPVSGRVAVFGAFVPGPLASGHAAQLFEPAVTGAPYATGGAIATRPFRVDPLPALVTVDEVLARGGSSGPGQPAAPLLLGVGGDELRTEAVRLPDGGVLAVLGGPGSGKSSLLAALPRMNRGRTWLAPQRGTDPGKYWPDVHASALRGVLDRTAIALADDADLLSQEANSALAALNSLGWSVILAAGFGPAFGQRVVLAAIARSQGRAVLICPRGLMDGEPFGVRFDAEDSPPPGRAVVISDGRATPVQLAAAWPAGRQLRLLPGQHEARDGPLESGRGSGGP
ncbi:FtsK/SpoIIIE domain-containing protein [Arthrobacter sp. 2MCAF15]|uniref:FtsK/SpoIIIE domain-containing protein n=1 Tax=Arthrobacter sp. 2MCAF15 TaxID=3232984 RepID=UPI003F93CCFA